MARHDGLLPSNVSLDAPRASSAWSQQGQQGNGGAGWAEEALRAELLRDATTAGAKPPASKALGRAAQSGRRKLDGSGGSSAIAPLRLPSAAAAAADAAADAADAADAAVPADAAGVGP